MRSGLAALYPLFDACYGVSDTPLSLTLFGSAEGNRPLPRFKVSPKSPFFLCSPPQVAGQKGSERAGKPFQGCIRERVLILGLNR
jgi:hypothetical protein